MTKSILNCLALSSILTVSGLALGQDLNQYMQSQMNVTNAMMQNYYGQMDDLNRQMQDTERRIVNQNTNDPRIQQMYQSYVAQGMPNGQMTFQQFAYYYGATGGFTNEGINQYRAITRSIQAQDAAAIQAYQTHVNNLWTTTQIERNNVFDRQQRDVGDLMTGSTNYTDSMGGRQNYLPYTAPTGQTFVDYYGRTYTMNGQGNYEYVDANGYTHLLNPNWNR